MFRHLVLLVAVTASSGATAGAYEGVYGLNEHWDCASVGLDGGAVEVKGNEFQGIEELCTLDNPTQIRGMRATLYDADCWSEGDRSSSRFMLMRAYDGGLITVSDGHATHWKRWR